MGSDFLRAGKPVREKKKKSAEAFGGKKDRDVSDRPIRGRAALDQWKADIVEAMDSIVKNTEPKVKIIVFKFPEM